jgi:arsenite/tail-anchored protein-transporting ATPase
MLPLTPWTLVGGKGGVGKTTTAAALAVEMAEAGERVLVISVDPAHSLGDALGVTLGPEPCEVPIAGAGRLEAMEVDAAFEQRRFLDSRRASLLRLLERGTYLDAGDVEEFVDLAVPGMDEMAALLRLLEIAGGEDRRVVIDTAPTGHTLRLLELPRLARGWLGALDAMEEKHRAVAGALTGAVREDDVTEMLATLDRELAAFEALLRDPARTRFVLVSNPEPVVLQETLRFQDALERLGVPLAGIVVNRATQAPEGVADARMLFVPPLAVAPVGVEGLRRFAAAVRGSASPARKPPPVDHRLRLAAAFRPPSGRTLHLVGGKGGVGKSSAACALAISLCDRSDLRVLLLGTDPAGSLADVLGFAVSGVPRPVPGVPGLEVRELDAGATWDRFREQYRAEAERLFAGLLGGMSATADRRVVERLIDLAPPGIDELMALLEVIELLDQGRYGALVLDTAPTGHLIRLLEMPETALEWTHSLMRLLLKYREVIGLGELAERVLRLARSLRGLIALLADPERSWFLAVALPEALSVPETERLLGTLRQMRVPFGALLVNRSTRAGELIGDTQQMGELVALAGASAVVAAPLMEPGPVGEEALREFIAGWRRVETAGANRTMTPSRTQTPRR